MCRPLTELLGDICEVFNSRDLLLLTFIIKGNGNNIGSGNNGISIGRRAQKVRKSDTLGNYLGNVVDSVTVPVLDPTSPNTIWASPAGNGNNNGDENSAGSNNGDNGSNNGNSNGNNNGNNSQ